MKAMSLGRTRVSTSSLSPIGTTSMIFWPGWTYWPTVVTCTSLTTPSTGERSSRLRLRLADPGHRLALLLARGGDPALKVDNFAALLEQVGLRNDVLGRQRL